MITTLDNIIQGIYSILSSDSELSSMVKGIYFAKFPETEFPIVVVNHMNSSIQNYIPGLDYLEEHFIQINVYSLSNSAIEAINIGKRIMTLLDNNKLTENTVSCERVFESLIPMNEVWNVVIRYRIYASATR